MKALCYLHGENIVHLDIKPENIILDQRASDQELLIKLVGFENASRLDTKTKLTKMVGTPYYIAPEIVRLSYDAKCQYYDEKCDVWSSGIIMYIMLSGSPPFDGKTTKEIIQKVAGGEISYEDKVWKSLSPEGMFAMKQMLTYH